MTILTGAFFSDSSIRAPTMADFTFRAHRDATRNMDVRYAGRWGWRGTVCAYASQRLPGIVLAVIILVADVGVGVASGVGLVRAAQALAVETVVSLAEALLLTLSALARVFDVENAPAMILPRHMTPRSLRSSAGIDGEEKETRSVVCSLALHHKTKLNHI